MKSGTFADSSRSIAVTHVKVGKVGNLNESKLSPRSVALKEKQDITGEFKISPHRIPKKK